MPDNLSETSESQMSDFARLNSEGKFKKSERGQEQEQPEKRKVSVSNIILLIILLAILGIATSYFLGDESELGKCSLANECGKYNVFYIKGQGYVCGNDQVIGEGGIKTKLLMFKYASKKAVTNEPTGCSCIESRCEFE